MKEIFYPCGSTLFGTASQGGSAGNGVLYSIQTNGSGYTTLHHFTLSPGYPFTSTNLDGINPIGGLVVSGNTLFGKTTSGGTKASGVIFALNLNGSGFTTLFNFATNAPPATTNATGFNSSGKLLLSGSTLYGVATEGGTLSGGTLFSLTLPTPPNLTLIHTGTNAVLRWPTNAAGLSFTLQFSTNLASNTGWSTISPLPVIANGQHTVTNSIAGTQKFDRLSQ